MQTPRCFLLSLGLFALSLLPSGAATILITPVGVGTVDGSGGVNFAGMFDSQPADIPTVGPTSDPYGADYDFYSSPPVRSGYIDFGAGYDGLTITDIYLELRQWGDPATASVNYWWADTPDLDFNPDVGDVAQADLGLFNTGTPDTDQQWIQVFSGTATVARRYLVIQYTATGAYGEGNRLAEVAIAGTSTPEPSTLALLGISLMAVIGGMYRRRQSVIF